MKKKPGEKDIMSEIKVLQKQIMSFVNEQIRWNFKKLQPKAFEGANKPGKYLAWQLKEEKIKLLIK